MEQKNRQTYNFLGIRIPISLPIPPIDGQLPAMLLFLTELLYIGKANSNHWSPGQLMRLSMSEWQQQVTRYRTCGNYLPTYRPLRFTLLTQLCSMEIIWEPLTLQPILTTLKGQGILIYVTILHEKPLPMEPFGCNTVAVMIWLPTFLQNLCQL